MFETTPRKSLTTKQRVELFKAHNGFCFLCDCKINAGEIWDVEHRIPVAMGGTNENDNLAPAHRKCHAVKTKSDVAAIAKAKRIEAKHFGAKQPKQKIKSRGFRQFPSNTKDIRAL